MWVQITIFGVPRGRHKSNYIQKTSLFFQQICLLHHTKHTQKPTNNKNPVHTSLLTLSQLALSFSRSLSCSLSAAICFCASSRSCSRSDACSSRNWHVARYFLSAASICTKCHYDDEGGGGGGVNKAQQCR